MATYRVRLMLDVEVEAKDEDDARFAASDNAFNGQYTDEFELFSVVESVERVEE